MNHSTQPSKSTSEETATIILLKRELRRLEAIAFRAGNIGTKRIAVRRLERMRLMLQKTIHCASIGVACYATEIRVRSLLISLRKRRINFIVWTFTAYLTSITLMHIIGKQEILYLLGVVGFAFMLWLDLDVIRKHSQKIKQLRRSQRRYGAPLNTSVQQS